MTQRVQGALRPPTLTEREGTAVMWFHHTNPYSSECGGPAQAVPDHDGAMGNIRAHDCIRQDFEGGATPA